MNYIRMRNGDGERGKAMHGVNVTTVSHWCMEKRCWIIIL